MQIERSENIVNKKKENRKKTTVGRCTQFRLWWFIERRNETYFLSTVSSKSGQVIKSIDGYFQTMFDNINHRISFTWRVGVKFDFLSFSSNFCWRLLTKNQLIGSQILSHRWIRMWFTYYYWQFSLSEYTIQEKKVCSHE